MRFLCVRVEVFKTRNSEISVKVQWNNLNEFCAYCFTPFGSSTVHSLMCGVRVHIFYSRIVI